MDLILTNDIEIPAEITALSEHQRASLALKILKTLSSATLASFSDITLKMLKRDFIFDLPFELAFRILGFTDARTLGITSQVSSNWLHRSTDSMLWKTLFFMQGWNINEEFLDRLSRPAYIDESPTLWPTSPVNEVPVRINRDESDRVAYNVNFDFMHGYGSLPRERMDRPSMDWILNTPLNDGDSSPLALTTEPLTYSTPIADSPVNSHADTADIISRLSLSLNPMAYNSKYIDFGWKYIYQQRMQLAKNWRTGTYTSRKVIGTFKFNSRLIK